MRSIQKITPFLWLDHEAEDAARFYTSVFPDSKITAITRYGDAGPGPKGSVMTVVYELGGQQFIAINGGPHYKLSPAVSFVVNCETQAEVDEYWARLSEGGMEIQCGWLTDKFGLSWQVVPVMLGEVLKDADIDRTNRVMQAMFQMKKLDIAGLQTAYDATA